MERKKNNKTNHCCQMMKVFTADERVGIRYYPKIRSYYLDLIDGPAKQNISYCPFCSTKLPKCLRDKYYEILIKEYNIEDPYEDEAEKLFPEEFKSNEWWKKRDL